MPSAILIYLNPLLPPSAVLGRVLPAKILPSFLSVPFLSVRGYGSTSTSSSALEGTRTRAHIILRGGGGGGQGRMEGVVNGIRATARKAKVIEHDLSVGRNFYRRPPPLPPSLKVAVTTTFAARWPRERTLPRGIYARPYTLFRPDDEGLIVNFAVDSRPGASA